MSQSDGDSPPGVDFLSEDAARKWAEEAEAKLVSRINFFAAFVHAIIQHRPSIPQVLELGSGPGFLDEYILSRCADIKRYKALFMTEDEQVDAIGAAGFSNVQTVLKTAERLACQAIA
jgi:hypothetical protein